MIASTLEKLAKYWTDKPFVASESARDLSLTLHGPERSKALRQRGSLSHIRLPGQANLPLLQGSNWRERMITSY